MIFTSFLVAIMDGRFDNTKVGSQGSIGHLLLWIVLIYVVEIVEKYLIHELKARPLLAVFISTKVLCVSV